jgi:hypothetical protein
VYGDLCTAFVPLCQSEILSKFQKVMSCFGLYTPLCSSEVEKDCPCWEYKFSSAIVLDLWIHCLRSQEGKGSREACVHMLLALLGKCTCLLSKPCLTKEPMFCWSRSSEPGAGTPWEGSNLLFPAPPQLCLILRLYCFMCTYKKLFSGLHAFMLYSPHHTVSSSGFRELLILYICEM